MKPSVMYRLVILLACTTSCAIGQAQHETDAQNGALVVTLNFNAAVFATSEARQQLADLQAKLAPREAQVQQLNSTVEVEKKQLDSESPRLNDDVRRTRIQSLNEKTQELQRQTEDLQNDSRTAAEQIFQHVAEKLFGLLADYAKSHGYSLVVERGTETAPVVWYAAAHFDITDELVKAYDLKFGTSPPTQTSPALSPGMVRSPSAPQPR